jgi:hypothetical protein
MQKVNVDNAAQDFMRKLNTGLSERRVLEEVGKLSGDELAAVLLMWHKAQTEAPTPTPH